MRIAILGNSHAAALKLALDEEPALAGPAHLRFFAAGRQLLAGLRRDGARLVAEEPGLRAAIERSSGGLREIDVQEYDAFLVHGLGLSYPYALIGTGRYSAAFCREYAGERWRLATATRLCALLREAGARRVLLSPVPLRSEHDAALRQRVAAGSGWPCMAGLLQAHLAAVPGVEPLPQPPDTIVAGVLTGSRWSTAPARLNPPAAGGDETDYLHMNSLYGRRVIERLLEALGLSAR